MNRTLSHHGAIGYATCGLESPRKQNANATAESGEKQRKGLDMKISEVKTGDVVIRNMCGVEMKLKVSEVTDDLIICGDWHFNRVTGGEVDEEIGSDGYDRVCSILTGVCKRGES